MALSAAALLLFVAPAASAASLTIKDGGDDVWVAGTDGQPDVRTQQVAEADIRRAVVRHGARVVVVRAKFADLTRKGAGLDLVAEIRTDEGVRRGVELLTNNYTNDPAARETIRMWKGVDQPVRCAVQHKVDYSLNTMSVTVPRTCLGGPTWVQVRIHNAWLGDGYKHAYVDNPHNDKSRFTGWSARVRRG